MVSREQLYELVWSMPMTKVAEKFSVSGSYMARVCSVIRVPHPERGYWAKLNVGKAPARPALPEALQGDQLVWSQDGDLPQPPLRVATAAANPVVPRARWRIVTSLSTAHSLPITSVCQVWVYPCELNFARQDTEWSQLEIAKGTYWPAIFPIGAGTFIFRFPGIGCARSPVPLSFGPPRSVSASIIRSPDAPSSPGRPRAASPQSQSGPQPRPLSRHG